MKRYPLSFAILIAGMFHSLTSFAVECRVQIPYPEGKMEGKFSGGCKAGLAEGNGRYVFSIIEPNTNARIRIIVSGKFSNGKLNGDGMLLWSDTSWSAGTFKDGKPWNSTFVGIDNGVRFGNKYEEGERVALCRQDMPQPRCTPELQRLLSTTSPPKNLIASSIPPKTPVSPRTVSGSRIQVIGSAPNIDAEWAADACGAGSGDVVADRKSAIKIEFFDSMKAGDVNIGGAVPKTATVYPVEITYKLLISSSFDENKQYTVGTRRGFIYKSAFGKTECYGARSM